MAQKIINTCGIPTEEYVDGWCQACGNMRQILLCISVGAVCSRIFEKEDTQIGTRLYLFIKRKRAAIRLTPNKEVLRNIQIGQSASGM